MLGVVCWAIGSPALACSRAAPVEYAILAAGSTDDTTPPSPFRDVQSFAMRRVGTRCADGQCTESSCGHAAAVELTFTPPEDDRSPQGQLGYRLEWLDGNVPASMQAAVGPRWPLGHGRISLDLGFEEVVALDATIVLIAIDRAGNESAPSEPVHLSFSGCTKPMVGETCFASEGAAVFGPDDGCSVAKGASRASDSIAVLGAIIALVRRRRRS